MTYGFTRPRLSNLRRKLPVGTLFPEKVVARLSLASFGSVHGYFLNGAIDIYCSFRFCQVSPPARLNK